MRESVILHPGQITWHVVELQSDSRRHQSFIKANVHPRMLRWIVEPYAATHRITSVLRRHAPSGLSSLRLSLDPIDDAEQPLVIHANLVSLPAIVQAA